VSSFNSRGELDVSRPILITCLGKKGSGKSVMGKYLFASYPYDRLVIDVAGDDGPMRADLPGQTVVELHGDCSSLPARWPEHERKDRERITVRYVPDAGSPTFIEDMDYVIGLGRSHERTAILVHEMGVLASSNRTPPHTRRLLQMSRHAVPGQGKSGKTSAIFCGPRALTMDPLVIAQSDLVFVFEMPNPDDQKRVADTIGWPREDFVDGMNRLGEYGYLRYDARQARPERPEDPDLRLLLCPALPEDIARSVA